jgi:phage tail-like protein
MSDAADTLRFAVEIQGFDLGTFTAVDGLSAHYETEQYTEGGENEFVHVLPKGLSYENVKVSRPLNGNSAGLSRWFHSLSRGMPAGRRDATITAYNDEREVVASWTFTDMLPVKYQGPSFSTDGGKVAIETLEFAHRGLMPGESG